MYLFNMELWFVRQNAIGFGILEQHQRGVADGVVMTVMSAFKIFGPAGHDAVWVSLWPKLGSKKIYIRTYIHKCWKVEEMIG